MEGNIGATYTLIYQFLKHQSQDKAAEVIKRAAKSFVVLRDDIEQEGPSLEEIIKEWKMSRKVTSKAESSSEDSDSSTSDGSSDSESSSDSSSEDDASSESNDSSDSDDSSESSVEEAKAKVTPKQHAERDTSATLSSAEETGKGKSQKAEKKPIKEQEDKGKGSESDSDSESSDSNDSDSENSIDESSSSDSGSSNASDSSDEEVSRSKDASQPNKRHPKTFESSSSGSSSSSSESENESEPEPQLKEDTQVAKKRKTSESGAAVTTAVIDVSQQSFNTFKKEKPPPKVRERFQRVKVQNLPSELLLNNGYEAKGGATNDYGSHAHRDLIITRGAGFRKEKNKKKRGSYRGGEITMENHSIRFNF